MTHIRIRRSKNAHYAQIQVPEQGYLVSGARHPFVAFYIPEFYHIWTNPDLAKREVSLSLCEEFIHATETFLHPSELLPLLNYLNPSSAHPGHNDFRDIVEAIYFASWPLASHAKIDPRHPPSISSPHRQLGIQILETAAAFADMHNGQRNITEQRRQALWAVMAVLLNVVPLMPGRGYTIIDYLQGCHLPDGWTTSHQLYERLLDHLSRVIKQHGQEQLGFTLRLPNDPHELAKKTVELLPIFLKAPVDRVTATMPLLISVLTMGLCRHIRLLWLRRCGRKMGMAVDTWDFTGENIKSAETALRDHGLEIGRPDDHINNCPATYFYLNCLIFVKELLSRKQGVSAPYIVHEMLELMPYMLSRIILRNDVKYDCRQCNSVFMDAVLRRTAENLLHIPPVKKFSLIQATYQYDDWLKQGCRQEIEERLLLGKVSWENASHQKIISLKSGFKSRPIAITPATYNLAVDEGTVLAQFVPLLGHVWIAPQCPDTLLSAILSHELYHYDSCALQPSQLMHVWFSLLGRPLNEPLRFNDIMEISYVLGLAVISGKGLDVALFPSATGDVKRWAGRLAVKAKSLARTISKRSDDAESEAIRAILFLLHHIVPKQAGLASVIIPCIEELQGPLL